MKHLSVLNATKVVLELMIEPIFSDCSYGYRPNRSAQQAVKRVQQYAEEGYTYAVSLDLSKYFDTMNQHMLLNMVRVHVKDKRESSETSARI